MRFSVALSLVSLLPFTAAICPGYNYAFFNDDDNTMFYTTTTGCVVVEGKPCDNPCMCGGTWGCGPAGSVNAAKVNGLWYACRHDNRKGRCGPNEMSQVANNAPESCCRNDGNKNFAEGLITKRHAEVIEETNSILDRHLEEVEDAEKRGVDLGDLLRRHEGEVAEAMKREKEVAGLE
ncbi:hypothetical protein BJY04DRAFT_217204 [Aspergillus karnatakaensis]|uniref:uncharacterized protein n=1 Tax=Aspergillus karnatakaensis TaxID=1810916 RepID=UPI003CCDD620